MAESTKRKIDVASLLRRVYRFAAVIARAIAGLLVPVLAGPAAADCYDQAGARYSIAPALLRAISQVESGLRYDAIGRNNNGSLDLCAMQINTLWLPDLGRYGIIGADLPADECTCINAGAWILAGEIARVGYS